MLSVLIFSNSWIPVGIESWFQSIDSIDFAAGAGLHSGGLHATSCDYRLDAEAEKKADATRVAFQSHDPMSTLKEDGVRSLTSTR